MINIISFLIIYAVFCLFLISVLSYVLHKKYQDEITRLHIYYQEKYDYDVGDNYVRYI